MLKQKGKRIHLKTRMHPLNIGIFVQIQKVYQIAKLIKKKYILILEWFAGSLVFKTSFWFIAIYLDLRFWLNVVSNITRVSVREVCCKHHSSGRKIFPKVKVLSCFLKLAGSSSCPACS